VFWFAFYGAAFVLIGLLLRLVARWSGDLSLADAFGGGYRDLPWPQGVQEEEEPVRWDLQRLRRPAPAQPHGPVPAEPLTAGSPPMSTIGRLDQLCR
jgi:hypothetical protein